MKPVQRQRGGFVLGMVVGLLIGLALALGVALYITKAPVPFVNKVPQRTAEQDNAEVERNKNWNPNAPLAGKNVPPVPPPAAPPAQAQAPAASAPAGLPPGITLPPPSTTAPTTAPTAAASKPGRDPAAILAGTPSTAGGADPFVYFVQVGAYSRNEEAEQQRAKLAMIGFTGKVTEREQSGRMVYRLRVGPYETREEADSAQTRLQEASIDARLVRVER